MAFNYDPTRVPFSRSGAVDRKPPFRATGRGLAVDHPFVATQWTANATLSSTSRAPDGSVHQSKLYLFVTRVTTAWDLSGETAQTRQSRAFYPRNLSQRDFVVQGVMPSQKAYDQLVEFVQAHHMRITEVGDNPAIDSANQTNSVTFAMGQPAYGDARARRRSTYRQAPPIYWDIAITSVAAGHERFKFQPPFQLTCKVLDDRRQPSSDVEFDILRALDYQQVFGELGNPLPEGTIMVNGKLVPSTQHRIIFSGAGGARAGTGGAGGGDYSPGDIDAAEKQFPGVKAWVAGHAPGLSNPEKGNPIKAGFAAAWPPDAGKQYFASMHHEGNSVKFRDPPGAGNTLENWRG